jgi:glycine amidinotransferase
VEETVFDVNMLSISEELVLVNNYNREVFDFLKKHSIEPIVCPLRHRYFWDGGIHCLTLDLVREGNRENYF